MPLAPFTSSSAVIAWNAIALLATGALFCIFFVLARRTRRRPAPFDAAIALSMLVCSEAIAVNALSAIGMLGRGGLLWAHIGLGAAGLGAIRRFGSRSRRRARLSRLALLTISPIAILVLLSAFRYAPNSGDAMTYHLARVAHWIQNSSVAPYPSGSIRQNVMMPGAEYLLTAIVGISRCDHAAALPQLLSWFVVALCSPALARLAGAPRAVAWIAVPLVAAAPMAVLQASSTQNDLVAAAMAVAVVAAALPFFHGRRIAARDVLALATACAAAGLVKASAVAAAAPFGLLAAAGLARAGLPRARVALALAAAVALAAGLVGTEAMRRGTYRLTGLVVDLYGATDPLLDRAANAVRGLARHAAIPFEQSSRESENNAGNPLQAGMALALLALVAARFNRVPLRTRMAVGAWLAGWLGFHAIVKDNEYLSRLQLPWFALLPLLLAALAGVRIPRARARWVTAAVGAVLLAHGAWAAAQDQLRPPLEANPGPRDTHAYRANAVLMLQHRETLRRAREAGCRRLALFMGESGWDYPLTRAAMSEGMATRHLVADDGWACLIYVDHLSWGRWNLPRPEVALSRADWSVAATGPGGAYLFLRRPAR